MCVSGAASAYTHIRGEAPELHPLSKTASLALPHRGYREIALHDREHIRRAEPLSGEVVTPAGNREGSSRSCSTCKPLCLIFTKT